ncbi:muscarinic acetylcholine receptor m4-like [Plakobranchus ocellatus]|uniref:Muscarinic acetylcholine receptor m4-like n=1 Tax=Plakobranchus ocellatus TaxID=259542 RepID=A0AAV4BIK9_9GAST|nr:muscarinic acetylcholine receptor m4-like [Plakobranchus ocellatus]
MASLVTAAVDNVTSSILPLLGAAGAAAAAAGARGGPSGVNGTTSLDPRLGSGLSGNVTCIFSPAHNTSLCTTESAGSTQPFITTPAPHTLPHPVWLLVIFGILAGVVAFVTNLGNIMVLVAFGLERTIRQPTNYFLASLAVSDLLIGTFSMPLYTQYLLQDQWVLGPWLCDLWLSLDWTVCLTSQYTVFLITMDRFLSVKIPAKYRNWRTERKVGWGLRVARGTWCFVCRDKQQKLYFEKCFFKGGGGL